MYQTDRVGPAASPLSGKPGRSGDGLLEAVEEAYNVLTETLAPI